LEPNVVFDTVPKRFDNIFEVVTFGLVQLRLPLRESITFHAKMACMQRSTDRSDFNVVDAARSLQLIAGIRRASPLGITGKSAILP